jgi:WD40 repeat protein
VTASDDTTARLWNAGNGKLLAELVGHTANVNTAKFSADGRSIITTSSDNTARIFACKECGSLDELLKEAEAISK